MTMLTKTRELIDQSAEQIGAASKTSFLGVISSFEAGRLGRDDALLQLRLATMGPAAGSDAGKMNDIIASFEAESKG